MSLKSLFGRTLDPWTERVVSALYLHNIEPKTGMFDLAHGAAIRDLWEQLRNLPPAWATELCVEALEQNHD